MPTMPNVIGLEYPAALTAMVSAGVRALPLGYFQTDPVTLSWVKNAAILPNVVIGQTPAGGTMNVAANSAVQLTVSNLPVSVAYPAGGTNV